MKIVGVLGAILGFIFMLLLLSFIILSFILNSKDDRK